MPGTFVDTWDMASNNIDKNITVIECTDKCISEIYTRSNGDKLYKGEIKQRGEIKWGAERFSGKKVVVQRSGVT